MNIKNTVVNMTHWLVTMMMTINVHSLYTSVYTYNIY